MSSSKFVSSKCSLGLLCLLGALAAHPSGAQAGMIHLEASARVGTLSTGLLTADALSPAAVAVDAIPVFPPGTSPTEAQARSQIDGKLGASGFASPIVSALGTLTPATADALAQRVTQWIAVPAFGTAKPPNKVSIFMIVHVEGSLGVAVLPLPVIGGVNRFPGIDAVTTAVTAEIDLATTRGKTATFSASAALDAVQIPDTGPPTLTGDWQLADFTVTGGRYVETASVSRLFLTPSFDVTLGSTFSIVESVQTQAINKFADTHSNSWAKADFLNTFSMDLETSTPGVALQQIGPGATVPEPASWALLGLGVCGLVVFRRRWRLSSSAIGGGVIYGGDSRTPIPPRPLGWVLLLAALAVTPSARAGPLFSNPVSFDFGSLNNTFATGIDSKGNIAGFFVDFFGNFQGYERFANGTFSPPLIHPNDQNGFTRTIGLNDKGTLVGDYEDSAPRVHGLTLTGVTTGSTGTFTTFDVPSASSTSVLGINNAGHTTGTISQPVQGFFNDGTTVTTFTVSGATVTAAHALNNLDQIVGNYTDGGGSTHAFLRDAGGGIMSFDFPGVTFTSAFGINDAGLLVGVYQDPVTLQVHGFAGTPGHLTSYDFPGSTNTTLNGVNNGGELVGSYTDPFGQAHGFEVTFVGSAGVPEPDGLILLGVALPALAWAARRRLRGGKGHA